MGKWYLAAVLWIGELLEYEGKYPWTDSERIAGLSRDREAFKGFSLL